MAQRIVTDCDVHAARDETVPGQAVDVAVRTDGGSFRFVTIDLCEACSKPLVDLLVEFVEHGRDFDPVSKAAFAGTATGTGRKRGRPVGTQIKERTEKSQDCPLCGNVYASMSGMRTHLRDIHGKSYADVMGDAAPFKCRICADGFTAAQGLSAHLRASHPVEYAEERSHADG